MAARNPKTAVGFKAFNRVDLTLPVGEIDFDSRTYEYEYDTDRFGRTVYSSARKVRRTPETAAGVVKERGDESIDWEQDPQDARIEKEGRSFALVFGEFDYEDRWEGYLTIRLDRAIKALDSALELEIGKSLPKLRNLPYVTRARANVYVVEAPCGDTFAVRKETLRNFSAALKKAEKALS